MEHRSHPEPTKNRDQIAERPLKKPYVTPQLVVHGTVQDITRTTGPNPGDDPFGGS